MQAGRAVVHRHGVLAAGQLLEVRLQRQAAGTLAASQPESKTSATAASSASSIDGRVSGTGEGKGGHAAGNVAGACAAIVSGLSGRGQPPAGGQRKS